MQQVYGPDRETQYGKPMSSITRSEFPSVKIVCRDGWIFLSWPVDSDGHYADKGEARHWTATQVPILRATPTNLEDVPAWLR